ncbi:MAG: TetR/AcrR family transcriptional regulator [Cytophagales bacterium]|nr:TetR/AcrR family transcriptional regulator [Cytophaga sp.]
MDEIKSRIITEADTLFLKFGVKSITMDEIAKNVGMSKKTIYQHVNDKDELVKLIMQAQMDHQELQVQLIHATSKDPVDEVLRLSDYLGTVFANMNPFVLMEIQRYHPKAFDIYLSYKETCLLTCMYENLKWGIEMGLYRPEINIDILSRLRMQEVEWGFNPQIFKESVKLHEIQIQLIEHFLYGICTLKGHKLINKYKQVLEEE